MCVNVRVRVCVSLYARESVRAFENLCTRRREGHLLGAFELVVQFRELRAEAKINTVCVCVCVCVYVYLYKYLY